nr:hypothetical protein [Tanacetum cinerariifolium]
MNELSSIGTSSGSGPRRQETMRDAAAQTRSERVSIFSNDPPHSRVNTLRSEEDRLQLKELMELCTKLFERVLNLETTKTVGNKMHKAFSLLKESSHWQYNFPLPVEGVPTARRMEIPLLKSLHCYDEETASQRELAVTLRRWLIYVIPSHTKKVFSNMKRVGKKILGRDTPLFLTMIVQAKEELGEDTETPTDT